MNRKELREMRSFNSANFLARTCAVLSVLALLVFFGVKALFFPPELPNPIIGQFSTVQKSEVISSDGFGDEGAGLYTEYYAVFEMNKNRSGILLSTVKKQSSPTSTLNGNSFIKGKLDSPEYTLKLWFKPRKGTKVYIIDTPTKPRGNDTTYIYRIPGVTSDIYCVYKIIFSPVGDTWLTPGPSETS